MSHAGGVVFLSVLHAGLALSAQRCVWGPQLQKLCSCNTLDTLQPLGPEACWWVMLGPGFAQHAGIRLGRGGFFPHTFSLSLSLLPQRLHINCSLLAQQESKLQSHTVLDIDPHPAIQALFHLSAASLSLCVFPAKAVASCLE